MKCHICGEWFEPSEEGFILCDECWEATEIDRVFLSSEECFDRGIFGDYLDRIHFQELMFILLHSRFTVLDN
jgi:hypothetical protein